MKGASTSKHSVSTVYGRGSRSHVFLVNLSRVSTLIELVCVNESIVLIYSGVSALRACCVLSIFDNSSSILLVKCSENLEQPSCIEEKYGIFSFFGLIERVHNGKHVFIVCIL